MFQQFLIRGKNSIVLKQIYIYKNVNSFCQIGQFLNFLQKQQNILHIKQIKTRIMHFTFTELPWTFVKFIYKECF